MLARGDEGVKNYDGQEGSWEPSHIGGWAGFEPARPFGLHR